MAEVATLGLKVEGVSGIDDAARSLDNLSKSASAAETSADKMAGGAKKAKRDVDDLSKSTKTSAGHVEALAAAGRLATGVLAGAFSVRAMINYADTWSDLSSRVAIATGSQENAADVMGRLADIARMTYSDMKSTTEAFALNAVTLKALGKTTEQQLNYTEALNNALVVSGAKADRASMVQEALSRAMAQGTLSGYNLNAVLNSGSRVAELLAAELGVNVTQLRAVAAQGKITGDVIFTALTKNMETLAKEAESMPATIGDAFQLLRNALLETIGVYDKSGKISEGLAEGLVKISDAIRNTDWKPYLDALVSAAKISGAFLFATYAIPAAMAAATFATSAYTAIVAAFGAAAAITTRQLLSMKTGLNVVAAAFIGWEIGTYLRKEFAIVEQAGIALMSGLHKIAVIIGNEFKVLGETIKFAFTHPIDFARAVIADFLEWLTGLGKGALKALGFEELASNIKTEFNGIRGVTASEHKAMIAGMRAETAKELQTIDGIYAEMFANAVKGAKKTKEEVVEATKAMAPPLNALTGATEKLKPTNVLQDAVADEIRALERAVAILGKSKDEIQIYDLEIKKATKTQLDDVRAMQKKIASFEQAAEAQDKYKQLVIDLQTEEEKATAKLRERLAILDAMKNLPDAERSETAGRIAGEAFKEAPSYGGLAPEVGGAFGELNKIDTAQQELDDWHAKQLSMLEKFREERSDMNAQWDEKEIALREEYENKIKEIEDARQLAQLSAGEEFFGDMADAAKAYFGESSKLYKAAFMVEKSFAIKKALINVPKTYSDTYAAMAGIPYVGPYIAPVMAAAAAAVQVAQAAAIGSVGMAHEGIDRVPKSGTWLLEEGERVTTAQTSARLDATLDRISRNSASHGNQSKSSGPGVIVNLIQNKDRAGQVDETKKAEDERQRVINIFVADIAGDGKTAWTLQTKFGLQPQGI